MKLNKLLLSLFTILSISLSLASCNDSNKDSSNAEPLDVSTNISTDEVQDTSSVDEIVHTDYCEQLKLDLNDSSRIYVETTVNQYVDGDTTHFVVSDSIAENGIFKARYLAIDTPESTGKVEEWGKTASLFTRGKLESAQSIILQSDSNVWERASDGERILSWVWYRTSETAPYRLLNLEIVQEGYSMVKGASGYAYGEYFVKAQAQAIREKLHLWTDQKEADENYYYGSAQPITLKELRTNITEYNQTKVAVEGLVTFISGQTAYIEDFDEEEEQSFGISVYMGYTTYDIIQVGNILRFVGTVTFYEAAGTYQLSGLTYMVMKPDHPDNLKLISENNDVTPTLITFSDLDEKGENLQGTYVTVNNLSVDRVYTTNNGGNSDGAMTLTCSDSNGNEIKVRTAVIKKQDGTLVTEDDLINQNINVVGIVDKFEEEIQVRVFSYSSISFN